MRKDLYVNGFNDYLISRIKKALKEDYSKMNIEVYQKDFAMVVYTAWNEFSEEEQEEFFDGDTCDFEEFIMENFEYLCF